MNNIPERGYYWIIELPRFAIISPEYWIKTITWHYKALYSCSRIPIVHQFEGSIVVIEDLTHEMFTSTFLVWWPMFHFYVPMFLFPFPCSIYSHDIPWTSLRGQCKIACTTNVLYLLLRFLSTILKCSWWIRWLIFTVTMGSKIQNIARNANFTAPNLVWFWS